MSGSLIEFKYSQFKNTGDVRAFKAKIHTAMRNREFDLGRGAYATPILMAVSEAICCGHPGLTVVEMGVAGGNGLLDMCKAASYFREHLEMDIRVLGFDNATGLPPALDIRDHPEIWETGDYKMPDPDELRAKLPDFAELIIGDVADTASGAIARLETHPLGFASFDVDYYSSTVACLRLLDGPAASYLPATFLYFDDHEKFLTNTPFAGEPLAIAEFNQAHATRKLQRRTESAVRRLYTLDVLDHPFRLGERKPRFPLRVQIV